MQPTPKGKDVLDVGLTLGSPAVGEETCAIITTGMASSGLTLIVNVGSRIIYSGTAPSTLEVCFTPLPGEEGEGIGALVVQSAGGAAGVAATALGEVKS
ncbi:MAG: hypothetical protein RL885_22520 [Planctomycetota bacterium]